MCLANANCNGKIWYFVADNIDVEVLIDSPLQITLKLFLQDLNQHLITTLVYAKYSASESLELWEDIYHLSNTLSCSWLIGGDFNVFLNDEEKTGGNLIQPQDIEDFAFCINSCDLEEVNFKGSPFTWWNGIADEACIFERLDRMLVNSLLLDNLEILKWNILQELDQIMLHFFVPMVISIRIRLNWSTWEHEDPFINFKSKMKKLKEVLSKWSKEVFGDIFKQLIIREEIVRLNEQLFDENLSQGRRKKLQIKRIQNSDGSWIEDDEQMADEAVHFYSQQFSQEELIGDENLLSLFPVFIDQNRNDLLCQMPRVDEVKKAVFNLGGSSASGPDSFPGIFYQTCWDIISLDVYKVVVAFF
ncbi:uncharacterized protein LOC132601490 [Lycium barbarum]|uniref:uncharacterized protein LOC132601490 n=1 Tax=Lycium barbarum TaxID=112863 RepID=UPI00293F170F|nr:uncharacterized protein LOC132601490 [Lycium barbarum]